MIHNNFGLLQIFKKLEMLNETTQISQNFMEKLPRFWGINFRPHHHVQNENSKLQGCQSTIETETLNNHRVCLDSKTWVAFINKRL